MVGFSKTKIFKYLMIAGGLYLVYKWWTDEGSAPFPDCIGKNIPKEDFERMVNEGDGSVIISDTGVEAIDRAGGGKFYDDKKICYRKWKIYRYLARCARYRCCNYH